LAISLCDLATSLGLLPCLSIVVSTESTPSACLSHGRLRAFTTPWCCGYEVSTVSDLALLLLGHQSHSGQFIVACFFSILFLKVQSAGYHDNSMPSRRPFLFGRESQSQICHTCRRQATKSIVERPCYTSIFLTSTNK
jgi:hypothetical protein